MKQKKSSIFTTGIFKENPIFVMVLGMCPALAITTTLDSALGMGILVILVLTCSNIVVSLLKKFVPNEIRTPAYIVVIATFVTIVSMLTEAYAQVLFVSLGAFISLIVVNCLILGRAEAFASKNSVIDSIIDGLGMGLGYTLALCVIGIVRELFGTGQIILGQILPLPTETTLFSLSWFGIDPSQFNFGFFVSPAGAFIALGLIMSVLNIITAKKEKKKLVKKLKEEVAK